MAGNSIMLAGIVKCKRTVKFNKSSLFCCVNVRKIKVEIITAVVLKAFLFHTALTLLCLSSSSFDGGGCGCGGGSNNNSYAVMLKHGNETMMKSCFKEKSYQQNKIKKFSKFPKGKRHTHTHTYRA